jgi:two-component system chemotaxis response regulator CheB
MTASISILLVTTENQVTTGIARLLRSLRDTSLRLASCQPSEISDYNFAELSLVLVDNEMPAEGARTIIDTIVALPEHPPVILLCDPKVESMRAMLTGLDAGAADFLPRPSEKFQMDPNILSACIAERIDAYARQITLPERAVLDKLEAKHIKSLSHNISIAAFGLGTGGTKALLAIIPQLPKRIRIACLVVLQAPPLFIAPLSEAVAERCPIEVYLARHHLEIIPGRLILASSAMQMGVIKCDSRFLIEHTFADTVSGQLPSIDYLFRTIADTCGAEALCVLMTGCGSDGVSGLRLLKSKGALLLGQHPETNAAPERVVQAIELSMFSELVPIHRLAKRVREIVNLSEARQKEKAEAKATQK